MPWCKTAISSLLMYWRHCNLALNHRYVESVKIKLALVAEHCLKDSGYNQFFDLPLPYWRLDTLSASFHQAIRRPIVRSCELSKLRDWVLTWWYRFCHRDASRIAKQLNNTNLISHSFETSRDLVRRLIDGLVQERRNSSALAMG